MIYLRTRTVLDLVVLSQVTCTCSFRSCPVFFMSGRTPARKLFAHFRLRRSRRGENLVQVQRRTRSLAPWLKELEDTSPANETEGQNTKSASRTKLLENGRDSELPQRESQAQM